MINLVISNIIWDNDDFIIIDVKLEYQVVLKSGLNIMRNLENIFIFINSSLIMN